MNSSMKGDRNEQPWRDLEALEQAVRVRIAKTGLPMQENISVTLGDLRTVLGLIGSLTLPFYEQNDQSQRKLAEAIAAEIFMVGHLPNRPVSRIAFKSGNWRNGEEKEGGGLCRIALENVIHNAIRNYEEPKK